jgi:hypothetical protein
MNVLVWDLLPTAVSTISAVTPVAIPAATTAPAASPAPSSTSASTKAPTPSPAATAFSWRPSFVDDDIAAHEIATVQCLYGALGFLVATDLDESEPARLS